MYQFRKARNREGTWRFELNGIKLLVNDFVIRGEKHWLKDPAKTIGFFNVDNNLYGVSNTQPVVYNTAEDFYESLVQQYHIIKDGLSSGCAERISA